MKAIPQPSTQGQVRPKTGAPAFTLVEFLVAFAIMAVLMSVLFGMLSPVIKAWTDSQRSVEIHQRARGALELITREMTPAVVDTRMQFVILPGEELASAGAKHVAPNSPALLWMAPLGEDGEIRCVGYYLFHDPERRFYRLKRIYVRPRKREDSDERHPYFPRLVNITNARDLTARTSSTTARAFLDNWDEKAFDEEDLNNGEAIVSTAADGVIAMWVQPLDLLGNPVPWISESKHHPNSELIYNSAAFMQMATTEPFDDGATTVYLAQTSQSMKANRVPSAVDITVVTIDDTIIAEDWDIPPMPNLLDSNGALDMEASVKAFLVELENIGLRKSEVFSTRVKLVNGT